MKRFCNNNNNKYNDNTVVYAYWQFSSVFTDNRYYRYGHIGTDTDTDKYIGAPLPGWSKAAVLDVNSCWFTASSSQMPNQ